MLSNFAISSYLVSNLSAILSSQFALSTFVSADQEGKACIADSTAIFMSFRPDFGTNAIISPVAGEKFSNHSPVSGSINSPDI